MKINPIMFFDKQFFNENIYDMYFIDQDSSIYKGYSEERFYTSYLDRGSFLESDVEIDGNQKITLETDKTIYYHDGSLSYNEEMDIENAPQRYNVFFSFRIRTIGGLTLEEDIGLSGRVTVEIKNENCVMYFDDTDSIRFYRKNHDRQPLYISFFEVISLLKTEILTLRFMQYFDDFDSLSEDDIKLIDKDSYRRDGTTVNPKFCFISDKISNDLCQKSNIVITFNEYLKKSTDISVSFFTLYTDSLSYKNIYCCQMYIVKTQSAISIGELDTKLKSSSPNLKQITARNLLQKIAKKELKPVGSTRIVVRYFGHTNRLFKLRNKGASVLTPTEFRMR